MGDFDKRKYMRYPTEPNELVTIYYLNEKGEKTGQRVGLGENESFNGCCVVFVGDINLKEGQEVLCELGMLPKLKAKVAWVKRLDSQVTKVGFSMME
jgi:hypothetical protein